MSKEFNSNKDRTITVLKCQQCGAPLNVITNSQLIKCESCGTINKLPEVGNLKIEVSSKDDVYEMSSAEQMLSNLYDEATIWKQKGYYQRSLEKFSEIKAYRDSAQQIEELEITIDNERKYQKAIKYIKQKLYEDAMVLLNEILSYKNAGELHENCKRLIEAKGKEVTIKEGKPLIFYIVSFIVIISLILTTLILYVIDNPRIEGTEDVVKDKYGNSFDYSINYVMETASVELKENVVGTIRVPSAICIHNKVFKVVGLKDKCFQSSYNVSSIYIPETINYMGNAAFSQCVKLKTVDLSETNVKILKSYLFNGCLSLESIVIPDTVTKIEYGSFLSCTSLKEIIYNGTEEQWNLIEKDQNWDLRTGNYTVTYNINEQDNESTTEEKTVEEIGEETVEENEEIIWKTAPTHKNYNTMKAYVPKLPKGWSGYIIIPNEATEISYGREYTFEVTYVSEEAFKDLTEIKKIFIKSGVVIGDRAFWGCTCEIEFEEPSSVTQTNRIFAGYKGNCLNLPKSIASISDYAFSSSDGVVVSYLNSEVHEKYQELWDHGIMIDSFKEIRISKNITNIGYCAFFGCKDLKDIWYEGTKQEWNNILKAKGWNYNTPNFIIHCTDGIIRKTIEKGD